MLRRLLALFVALVAGLFVLRALLLLGLGLLLVYILGAALGLFRSPVLFTYFLSNYVLVGFFLAAAMILV